MRTRLLLHSWKPCFQERWMSGEMQHKRNGQWESPQKVPPDTSSSFHLSVCYCFPNSHVVVAMCCHSKKMEILFYCINNLYLLFNLTAVTSILHSILVFSVSSKAPSCTHFMWLLHMHFLCPIHDALFIQSLCCMFQSLGICLKLSVLEEHS